MIGDLELNPDYITSRPVEFVIKILRLTGYIRGNKLTKKGILLSHYLMKNVVENLPFPLQNPSVIINNSEYTKEMQKFSNPEGTSREKKGIKTRIS
jgi:hypothetical protein